MKKLFLLMVISVVVLLSIPILTKGASIESLTGSIQGYDCVMQKKICPIGMGDSMAAIAEVLVLLVNPEEADYYVIPNVNQKVLARHINEEIKVVGYVDKKHNSIWAEEIYVGPKKVWSNKMQSELQKDIKGNSPMESDTTKNKE